MNPQTTKGAQKNNYFQGVHQVKHRKKSLDKDQNQAKPYVNKVNILASKKYASMYDENNTHIKIGGDQIKDPNVNNFTIMSKGKNSLQTSNYESISPYPVYPGSPDVPNMIRSPETL